MPDFGNLDVRDGGVRETFSRPMNINELDDYGRGSVASVRPN